MNHTRRAGLASLCLFFSALSPALAQQRPDLSGTWAATKETPAALPLAPGPVLGQQFAIRQDGEALVVTRRVRDANLSATFVPDGREVRSRMPGSLCTADSESLETAAWEGSALALTVVASVPPGGGPAAKSTVKRLLRLATPDTLVVEGSVRDGSASRAVGTVYRRSNEPMPAPAPAPTLSQAPATIAQMGWLTGIWVSATGSDERWTPAASGVMLAVSRTFRNGVQSAFEFICIVERGGSLVYQAMPNGRSPATDFALTRIDAAGATFENPSHDFPKMIRYTLLPDGTLEAVVSGDRKDRALTFTFKKQGQ